ncbi:hypothetical protein CHS0354_020573 [Potamilus streckersoni]|uniref:Uncharacterized protein n=1 Tax=Potamilus streckersoni TaxID=2493646 RepID=A0AAE0VYL1_9BIVA|nr:hypothetical protein CHS0354_020573 [Potamilus streckersoni]
MIKTKQLSKMRAIRNSCSICMGSLKNPILISCHHSFCSKCLNDYVRVNLCKGRFDCPRCRTSVELPKEGVSGFQTNKHVESDFVGNYICDLCGPKSVACRRCLDCNENLCMSCCHAHEKSKASRDHRISDLGTLDPKMKGKIRQRIFCDQHPEKDLELFCRQCKVLICLLCKAVEHNHHDTDTIIDAAAKVKKTLQTKMNSCSEKLRTIAEFKGSGEAFDIKINDAERKEIKALEDQRLQLMKVLDEEFAKMKDHIQSVYKGLMQQNADFIKYMQDEFSTYSDANLNTRKLIEQGSDIDVIKKAPELEKLISTAVSKTYLTPEPSLEMFVPANIKPSEIISLIGVMRESTKINITEREKPLRASHTSNLVAAIDIGTTSSGWAYSFKHEYNADPTKITYRLWYGGLLVSYKAPTTVLIKPDGITFDSFGYEAENRYADLKCENNTEYKRWYYFRLFKMLKHKKMLYESNVLLEDETMKSLPAKTVVSLLIRYLKDDVLNNTSDRLRPRRVAENEITWVLTVPAMWNYSAKQFIRETAVQAGITEKNILIALEPETASVFCRLLPIERMEEGGTMTVFSPGSKYMVLDAGGETIDITVHEVMTGGKLKVHKAIGEACGGKKVDDAYKEFFISLVGKPIFQRFQSECSDDHLDMLRNFEIKKRNVTPETVNTVCIRLPSSLLKIFEDETREDLRNAIKQTQYADKVSLNGEKLRVDASVMKGLFSTVIESTVSSVKELMKDSGVQGISRILMVGGFSESKMLQHAIKYNFPNVNIIVPQEAGFAVLKGAVVFGHALSQ